MEAWFDIIKEVKPSSVDLSSGKKTFRHGGGKLKDYPSLSQQISSAKEGAGPKDLGVRTLGVSSYAKDRAKAALARRKEPKKVSAKTIRSDEKRKERASKRAQIKDRDVRAKEEREKASGRKGAQKLVEAQDLKNEKAKLKEKQAARRKQVDAYEELRGKEEQQSQMVREGVRKPNKVESFVSRQGKKINRLKTSLQNRDNWGTGKDEHGNDIRGIAGTRLRKPPSYKELMQLKKPSTTPTSRWKSIIRDEPVDSEGSPVDTESGLAAKVSRPRFRHALGENPPIMPVKEDFKDDDAGFRTAMDKYKSDAERWHRMKEYKPTKPGQRSIVEGKPTGKLLEYMKNPLAHPAIKESWQKQIDAQKEAADAAKKLTEAMERTKTNSAGSKTMTDAGVLEDRR